MPSYAGFWKRFLAFMIDSIILQIAAFVFTFVLLDLYFGIGLSIILGFLYYPFFESSSMQATPGKALLGIAVAGESSLDRVTFKTAAVRFFCRYISMVIMFIGFLIQPFTKKRQTLHDIFSETIVIEKVTSAEENYFTAWKTQIKDVVAKL